MSASEKHPPGEGQRAPKPVHSDLELSASGFAGMLSQRRKKEPDPLGAPPPAPAAPREATPLPTPKPVANQPAATPSTSPEKPKTKSPPVPAEGWPLVLVPELYLVGWFLLALGAWGVLLWINKKILPGVELSDAQVRHLSLLLFSGIPLGALVMLGTRALQLKGRRRG